jgi:hypothetical protein
LMKTAWRLDWEEHIPVWLRWELTHYLSFKPLF